MSKADTKDLVVIGAGPGGYPAAFHAADLGMKVVLVDPEPNPGGVCLYRGCVPSKALLHVASFLHAVEEAPEWGVSLGEARIDIDKLRGWKESVVRNLTQGLGRLVGQRGIEYIQGRASLTSAHGAKVTTIEGQTKELAFEYAIVATGSLPGTIPGLPESSRIMTSIEALEVRDIPKKLLVVGGGYIGLELGQFYASIGSRVTVVEQLPGILSGVDRDLVRFLSRRLDKQGVTIKTETRVDRMEEIEDGVRVVFQGKSEEEGLFDKVMISVGRRPYSRGVGLENTRAGVSEKGFIEVNEQRRTAEPSIFAVGDVVGEPMLAHKATHEARVAVEAMAGRKTVFEPGAIPFVVFSDPEIAWCGLTQADAERQGRRTGISTFPWAASGRAATLSRKDGVTKLLSDPVSGRLLGAGLAGYGAGELLAEAVLAIEMGAVADDLALTIHTHPTLSETLMEAAQASSGNSTHFIANPLSRKGRTAGP